MTVCITGSFYTNLKGSFYSTQNAMLTCLFEDDQLRGAFITMFHRNVILHCQISASDLVKP